MQFGSRSTRFLQCRSEKVVFLNFPDPSAQYLCSLLAFDISQSKSVNGRSEIRIQYGSGESSACCITQIKHKADTSLKFMQSRLHFHRDFLALSALKEFFMNDRLTTAPGTYRRRYSPAILKQRFETSALGSSRTIPYENVYKLDRDRSPGKLLHVLLKTVKCSRH